MTTTNVSVLAQQMYDLIPVDKAIGNVSLKAKFGSSVDGDYDYTSLRNELLNAGMIVLGRGRGGSVKRISQ